MSAVIFRVRPSISFKYNLFEQAKEAVHRLTEKKIGRVTERQSEWHCRNDNQARGRIARKWEKYISKTKIIWCSVKPFFEILYGTQFWITKNKDLTLIAALCNECLRGNNTVL